MEKVKLDLEYCYGIKKLTYTFDFSGKRAYAIYAPNGIMKSSLAETFSDVAARRDSKDRIFPARVTKRSITNESGAEIDGDHVFAVQSYNDQLGPTEKTSVLLVDPKLRDEYSKIWTGIEEAKAKFLTTIQRQAQSRRDFEKEISSAFTNGDSLEVALHRIDNEVREQQDTVFANVLYDKIFDDKVLRALESQDVRAAIDDYIRRYNDLLQSSRFFKRGTFDYYNAGQIAKTLADNGFFAASHTVNLKGENETVEIGTQKELEKVVSEEKEKILTDKELLKKFDALEKKLQKNAELREFCHYMQNNVSLVACLSNIGKFREDILKSYIKANEVIYRELMKRFEDAKTRRAEIESAARAQQTEWENVIEIFNDRFTVPFTVMTKNREAVMLGHQNTVDLAFQYIEGTDSVEIKKSDLLTALSAGEKKALYILNVIFEIQRRIKDKQETLLVIDDLADSFDYQNKYAIIEYLKDTNEDGLFKQIIMTHNFDFFRTICAFVGYGNCLTATKSRDQTTLAQARDIRNPFVEGWKRDFYTDSTKKIASICFIRNLIEYTKGDADPAYLRLTSLLHWKEDTHTITLADLDAIYCATCGTPGTSKDPQKLVYELIDEEAAKGAQATGVIDLAHKLVLAIGIRLIAERFMIKKINDAVFVSNITENQTYRLTRKFKDLFPNDAANINALDKVSLMTPSSIHLNAFMYEPIVDTPDDSLRRLYGKVAALA